ncbi:MAG: hypothetical protein U9Q40_03820 [Campylobacterota bacterium]|nr:hypothetical protein [Campylobacterota bacterium]
MTESYRYAIAYFLLFSLLLLLSGVMLFEHKIGFGVEEIRTYYLGNSEQFANAKTYDGLLKTVLPHIIAFGVLSMVLLHFLIFTKLRENSSIKKVIYLLFISAFLEIFSPFFIISGADGFAYIKIASFVVFEALIVYIVWLLFRSIFYE